MGTKNNPGEYDCYAKAEPDEPMFILLGRDPSAPLLVELWARIRKEIGEDTEKRYEALQCASDMTQWAEKLGKRDKIGKCYKVLIEIMTRAKENDGE